MLPLGSRPQHPQKRRVPETPIWNGTLFEFVALRNDRSDPRLNWCRAETKGRRGKECGAGRRGVDCGRELQETAKTATEGDTT